MTDSRTRLDDARRSPASCETAPIGMTFRTDDLEIIDCIEAYARFVGAEVDSLVSAPGSSASTGPRAVALSV